MGHFIEYKRNTQILAISLVLTPGVSVLAADIQGIDGYILGSELDNTHVLKAQKAEDGATVYTTKAHNPEALVDFLQVRITPSKHIHRISAYSPGMSDVKCEQTMANLRKKTEQQFPSWSYYAMDQSEMFYQGDRTYTLECVKMDGKIRLRQEYSDDKLAKE